MLLPISSQGSEQERMDYSLNNKRRVIRLVLHWASEHGDHLLEEEASLAFLEVTTTHTHARIHTHLHTHSVWSVIQTHTLTHSPSGRSPLHTQSGLTDTCDVMRKVFVQSVFLPTVFLRSSWLLWLKTPR